MPEREGSSTRERSDNGSLYSLLNVSRHATKSDLKAAYRRMSQLYHPDKHVDPVEKEAATETFTRIKEAYEILSDTKLRRIYDEFGLEAVRKADTPMMELVPYEELRERFTEENDAGDGTGFYDDMRGAADPRFKMINALQAQVDATGLAVVLDYGVDALSEYGIRPAVLTQTMLSSRASIYVTNQDVIDVNYYLATNYGEGAAARSMGRVAATCRHQFSTDMYAEAGYDFGRGAVLGKVSRALSDDTSVSLEAVRATDGKETTMAISAERSLSSRNFASIRWVAGSQPAISFTIARRSYNQMLSSELDDEDDEEEENEEKEGQSSTQFDEWREKRRMANGSAQLYSFDADDRTRRRFYVPSILRKSIAPFSYIVSENLWRPIGARCTCTLSPFGGSLSGSLKRPVGENAPWFARSHPHMGGPYVAIRGSIATGPMWNVEAEGGQKYFERDAFWAVAIAVGSTGVLLRMNVGRAGHTLTLPFVLSSPVADPKIATIAALSTSVCIAALHSFIINPWNAIVEAERRKTAKEARREAMMTAKKAAEASLKLMKEAIQASFEKEREVPSGGLLIERAVYGLRKNVRDAQLDSESFVGREIEHEITEVGECLQALVEDSRLQIITSNKSTLVGFWDPTALGDDKMLKVWYRFRGSLHLCTIEEDEPLELPQAAHKMSS